jgi:WD40 repeat protein
LPHKPCVNFAEWSPGGHKVLTCGADGSVWIWNAKTSQPIVRALQVHEQPRSVTFSPDSKYDLSLTGGEEGRDIARLWRVPAPVEGNTARLFLWAQSLTGMELDTDGAVRALGTAAW